MIGDRLTADALPSAAYNSTWGDLMADVDYAELQRRYGGHFVARRAAEVVASAESYDELSEQLAQLGTSWQGLIIEYVEPIHVVCVY